MADDIVNAIPAKPPAGEIVTTAALYATQLSLYQNTQAFGGTRNPTTIWQSMTRNESRAMLFFRELEEKDTDVANGLDTLKESVLGRNWEIEPADKDDKLAVEIAQFVKDELGNVPNLDGVLDNMLDAPGYGFSVQENIYDVSMGQASLRDIRDCPQELFLFGDRSTPQIGPMQFLANPWASGGDLVPEEKFLIFTYRGRSRNRMGRPLLRNVFWSSWFKRNIQRLWVQYAEKGPGTAVVRYKDSDNPAEGEKAAQLALALIEQVAVGVPDNFDYDKELLTIARALDPAVHESFYKVMQLDIARRILGETLTTFGGEGGKGTQALGNVHAGTLDTKSVGLCKAVQSVINRQLIRPLVIWNYGPAAPMPKWAYDIEEQEDLSKRLGIDQGVQRMGVSLTENYVRERYGVPKPDATDVILVPNVSAPEPTITDTTRATFVDRARAESEMAEFDKIVLQLQDESLGLLKERTGEITDALAPAAGSGQ